MIIPPINTEGKFIFKEPFLSKYKSDVVYKVVGVRTIEEMYEAQEDPFEYVYKFNGLSETEFKDDLQNSVPIVTFTKTGLDFYYIPASYIESTPMLSGHRYREYMIGIKLPKLPVGTETDAILQILSDDVRDALGVHTEAKIIPSSSEILLDDIENEKMKRLLENSKKVYKSWKTKYLEEVEKSKSKDDYIRKLEEELKKLPAKPAESKVNVIR